MNVESIRVSFNTRYELFSLGTLAVTNPYETHQIRKNCFRCALPPAYFENIKQLAKQHFPVTNLSVMKPNIQSFT